MRLNRNHVAQLAALGAAFTTAFATIACTSTSTQTTIESAESAADVRAAAINSLAIRGPKGESSAAPRAAPPDDAALEGPLTLPVLEAAAIARQPSLTAAAHRVRALVERARAEGRLPPPELMSEVWQIPLERPYAIHDAGMIMVSLRQVIPPLYALDKMGEAMALEAQAEAQKALAEARSMVREVDRAFADYAQAKARCDAHEAHRVVVEQMVAAARARYETGGMLSDFTRADLELAKTQVEIAEETGMVDEARAKLNGLLARPSDAKLGEPRWGDPQTTALTPAAAESTAAEKNPEIAMAERMEQAAKASAEAASIEASVPMFMAGLSAFPPMGELPAGYGVSFSMSLPWIGGAGSARARSASERALAERSAVEGARLRARTEAGMALVAVRTAERRFTLLHATAAPAAQRAEGAAKVGYAGGGTDLLMWLDAARMLLEINVDLAGARGDIERALADLDFATGARAPRTAISLPKEPSHGK